MKPVEIPQVQFLDKVYMPVAVVASGAVCQTAQKTVEVPQLPFFASRRPPGHGAEADSHGLAYRDSAVAVCFLAVDAPVVQVWLDMPVVVQRQARMAQIVQKTVWKYRRCSSCKVVDVAVVSQRQSRLCREVPQTCSLTWCSSAEEGCFCCSFAAFFGLRPSGR